MPEGPDWVKLEAEPRLPLALDEQLYARSTFEIAGDDQSRAATPFIVTEREPQDNFTSKVKAVNYDGRFYDNDRDYLDGLIGEDGEPT